MLTLVEEMRNSELFSARMWGLSECPEENEEPPVSDKRRMLEEAIVMALAGLALYIVFGGTCPHPCRSTEHR